MAIAYFGKGTLEYFHTVPIHTEKIWLARIATDAMAWGDDPDCILRSDQIHNADTGDLLSKSRTQTVREAVPHGLQVL